MELPRNEIDPPLRPRSIDILVDRFGSHGKNLSKAVNYPNFAANLQPPETLPEIVQKAIHKIREIESVAEKAAFAHAFAQAYIKDLKQTDLDPYVSFEHLSQNPTGDCDDYAIFTKGLLVYSGINPRDVFEVIAQTEYKFTSEDKTNDLHAIVVVKNDDDYLLLDNNLYNVVSFAPQNPVVVDLLAQDSGSPVPKVGTSHEFINVEAKYIKILEVKDARGSNFADPDYINASATPTPLLIDTPQIHPQSQPTFKK